MLIDRILKLSEHPPCRPTEFESSLLHMLRQAEVILADNVADYLYCETPQESWNLKDFPNIAPPFPVMFIEYSFPRYIVSERYGTFDLNIPVRKVGSLLISRELSESDWNISSAELMRRMMKLSPLLEKDPAEQYRCAQEVKRILETTKHYEDTLPEEVKKDLLHCADKAKARLGEFKEEKDIRWVTAEYGFRETREGVILAPDAKKLWFVRGDGTFVPSVGDGIAVFIINEQMAKVATESQQIRAAVSNTSDLFVPLLTLCFMHCKNIIIKTVRPPERLIQVRVKRGKPSPIVYKILEIRPVKHILETEGEVQKAGLKGALHICRGHFKDYSIGKGLFGKFHGMYWWDMNIRGTPEAGTDDNSTFLQCIKDKLNQGTGNS
ncbi:hypothetical protein ES708_23567 [subsurface metagenome]